MSKYYVVSESLAGEMGSQFLTPPGYAVSTKWGDRWDTQATIEDLIYAQDETNPKVETLRIMFRVPADAESNQGRGFSEFFNFHWDAVEEGQPKNMVTRTQISYKNLVKLVQAAGMQDGPVSPGAVAEMADDLRGLTLNVQVTVGPDKTGIQRQSLGMWRAA